MSVRVDLTGENYGRLSVSKLIRDISGKKKMWLCKCKCGSEIVVSGGNLRSGHTTQCKECALKQLAKNNVKHGGTGSKLYNVWNSITNRTENKNHKSYADYGGRGIKICDEWRDFSTFLKWSTDSGYSQGLEIDRIDNDGDYSPENCQWVRRIENANNKRNNRWITHNGKTRTMAQWARIFNLNYKLLHKHLSRGYSFEEAVIKQGGV